MDSGSSDRFSLVSGNIENKGFKAIQGRLPSSLGCSSTLAAARDQISEEIDLSRISVGGQSERAGAKVVTTKR